MNFYPRLLFIVCLLAAKPDVSFSQSGLSSISGYVDPALSHNRLMREQNQEGDYKLIGTYKVVGSSYLYGEKHKGDIFSKDEKAYNISISYDTYKQEVEFYSSSNTNKPLVKLPGDLDSFIIKRDSSAEISNDILFIYAPVLGSAEKSYLQVIQAGPRFSIYKRYKSELGYVSSNYVQSELREFDLNVDYFYYDSETKALKKLKPNLGTIIKEFKNIKDVSAAADKDDFTTDPDRAFKKIFLFLNS